MTHEGLWWFSNLTLPDPLYGLPIACAALTLLMLETGAMNQEMNMAPQTQKTMKWVMRVLGLVVIPAGGYVSAAVGVLWVSNSMLSLVQASLLKSPAVRQVLKLPSMKAASEANSNVLDKVLGIKGQAVQQAVVSPPPPGMRPSRVVAGPRAGKKVVAR
jgi:membrane protein insertase Oxa1/YidC/SpoIIIJ